MLLKENVNVDTGKRDKCIFSTLKKTVKTSKKQENVKTESVKKDTEDIVDTFQSKKNVTEEVHANTFTLKEENPIRTKPTTRKPKRLCK